MSSIKIQKNKMRFCAGWRSLGEAVKHISDDIRFEYKDIPWRKIAGMRDIIIHEYFGVTLTMIWLVAKRDLPELKSKIQKVISDRK